ncbi:MAG TPA: serine/threonine-protein kinase [Gemmatimonadales bacterium]|nr:serine/threonine-protein kinase [Gemmatimonadales bacterium]
MDAARWERIQALFHEVADLPQPDQQALLAAQCREDAALMTEVVGLLEEDARGDSLLDRDAAHVAAQVLDAGIPPALLDQDFGPYRLREALGQGGMGVVYLAEREDLGSVAAIKILRDAWLSPDRRERFASEQRTLAQLNHPAIARLYDANTLSDGTPWFVMEYVEGVPLTEFCDENRSSIPERLRLFRAVCEAVEHAHGHLIVHRDLKPSNILVKADGSVKLLDFGIAKQLDSFDGPVNQTATGLRLMTPAYAAPEQILGERVGIHTDIYTLGVVLYELLTGQLPFDVWNRTPGEAEAAIVEQGPERPSAVAKRTAAAGSRLPSVSKRAWADLDVLCLTAMRKEPQRRYRTVDALIRDVDHYLTGEPLEARPDTVGYRVGKYVRRNWRLVSAAAASFVAVVSLVVFYTVRLATARNAAVADAARTQRIQRFMLNLFQGGDEAVGPADSLRVVTLLDRGVQEAQSLDGEPAVQAELLETLGSLYQKLGKLERADSLLGTALERRRSLFGSNDAEVAKSLVALGRLRIDQAQYPEAERLIREGLELNQRRLRPGHPAIAGATVALGQVLEESGQYDQGIKVLEQAVGLRRVAGDSPTAELAASMRELANTHFYAGHLAVADSLDRLVLAMSRKLSGARHPLVAEDLINLGAVQQQWGHYQDAERYYREALDITQAFYGQDHYKTAAALTMLGRALRFQPRGNDEAARLLERALAIRERVFGNVHPQVASTLNELGGIEIARKKFGAAEADARRVLAIYRTVYGNKHQLVGIGVSNLGAVYMAQQQYARAEPLFREAIRIFTETQGAEHLNTGIARIKLGRTLLRQRRYAEAAGETLAGYQILTKQTDPGVSWLVNARNDLVAAYDALKQPEKAAQFRAELADSAGAKR